MKLRIQDHLALFITTTATIHHCIAITATISITIALRLAATLIDNNWHSLVVVDKKAKV